MLPSNFLALSIRPRTVSDWNFFDSNTFAQEFADQFVVEATEYERLQQVAQKSELSRATEWLKRRLGDGKVYSGELKADAAEDDISERTLRRALIQLSCRKGKENTSVGQWYWRLPAPLTSRVEITTGPEVDTPAGPVAGLDQ